MISTRLTKLIVGGVSFTGTIAALLSLLLWGPYAAAGIGFASICLTLVVGRELSGRYCHRYKPEQSAAEQRAAEFGNLWDFAGIFLFTPWVALLAFVAVDNII